jgi:hypothetical protein
VILEYTSKLPGFVGEVTEDVKVFTVFPVRLCLSCQWVLNLVLAFELMQPTAANFSRP